MGSLPESRRWLGGGRGNPLQYSCLENPVDRGAWWATFHGMKRAGHNGVTKHSHRHPSCRVTQTSFPLGLARGLRRRAKVGNQVCFPPALASQQLWKWLQPPPADPFSWVPPLMGSDDTRLALVKPSTPASPRWFLGLNLSLLFVSF